MIEMLVAALERELGGKQVSEEGQREQSAVHSREPRAITNLNTRRNLFNERGPAFPQNHPRDREQVKINRKALHVAKGKYTKEKHRGTEANTYLQVLFVAAVGHAELRQASENVPSKQLHGLEEF